MRRTWVFVAMLGGCSFTPGQVASQADDAHVEPDDTMAPTDACVPSGYVDRCQVAGGTALKLTTGEYLYDTDTGVLLAPGSIVVPTVTAVQTDRDPDLRVLIVTDLVIDADATLYAIGGLPLAIVASGSIDVEGAIDVGARRAVPGAGGPAMCTGGAGRGIDDGGGASGGGGGGFGAAGGTGGTGDANGGPSAGGAAGPALTISTDVRGGCPGGTGGTGVDPGGPGGGAGGGLIVAAATSITVSGVVRASGGGGSGGLYLDNGDGDGGGGGGGAGGMIVLDAPALDLDGVIAANGGGGGGGAADVGAGQPGANGPDAASAATGGSGSGTTSADGGTGGYREMPAGKMPTELFNGAGGGGGGGVGFIVLRANVISGAAVISPAPQ